MISASAWWRIDGWPTTGEWQAMWAFVTVLVAVVAAWVAIRQLNAHYEAQREKSRPYVVVDFGFRHLLLMIEVKNIGATPAFDIKINWDPMPQAPEDRQTQILKRCLVDSSIPFLAPGRVIEYRVSLSPDYLSHEGLPHRYVVTAEYGDSTGQKFGDGETMVLDIDQWSESLAPKDGFQRVTEAIGQQKSEIKSMSTAVDRISKEIGVLHDSVRDAVKYFAAVGAKDSRVKWLVEHPSTDIVRIINVGDVTAEGLAIKDLTGENSAFHLCDRPPRDLHPSESFAAFLAASLESPRSVQVRLSWTEEGQSKEETLWLK